MKTKLTATERIRKNAARNTALAAKKAEGLDMDKAMDLAIAGAKSGEAGCRVFAVAMREAHGPGWYRLLEAEPNGDNEKAIKKALQERRTACRNRSIERGLTNPHKPWSDMLKCARELDNPFGETRTPKPLTQRVREAALQQYKAIGKADIGELPKNVQEQLMDAQRAFGAVLTAFGIDLTAINAKL